MLENVSSLGNYEQQSKQHYRKYKCKHCDYTAHTSSNLRNHVRVHTGERPYECPICKNNFSQKGNMLRHYTRHFTEHDDNCPVCHVKYSDNNEVIRHMNIHNPYANQIKTIPFETIL